MLITILYFIAGIVFLLGGAHLLVNSASRLATRLGVPAIFIGVTVVAFATSAPEIAVSIDAVMDGSGSLALGNVVGSNIANILLILGLSAIIVPIKVTKRIVWHDIPIMIFASILVYLLSLDQTLGVIDGVIMLIFFAGFMGYQIYQVRLGRAGISSSNVNDGGGKSHNPYLQSLMLILGFAILGLGAHWLVDSSIVMARYFGMSELIIGLTIIAIGTSLPELVTSVLAAGRNESDLSVGNVIGSNVFNLLLVLSISALFSRDGLPISNAAIALDIPFMIAVSVACLPIFFTGHVIARWEGVVFVGYYAAYLLFLFLDTTQHEYLPLFNEVMIMFVVPITILTLLIFVFRSRKKSTG